MKSNMPNHEHKTQLEIKNISKRKIIKNKNSVHGFIPKI